jgi:hypothetical protein
MGNISRGMDTALYDENDQSLNKAAQQITQVQGAQRIVTE